MSTVSLDAPRIAPATAVPRIRPALYPLVVIVAMQCVVSIATLHNSAFQDEALYLYAGRQLVHHLLGGPAPYDHYAYYFSGYPYVYPLIGGFLDTIGGLSLARDFSLACMAGVTTIVYFLTTRFFGALAGVFAIAIYAFTGVVLFVGRLATFDALCLLLIASATAIAIHVPSSRRPWLALAVGPVMVLAILAKYAALLWVPSVFALLAWQTVAAFGWRRGLGRLGLGLGGFAISLVVVDRIIDKAAFHAIAGSTTNRTTGAKAPTMALFLHVLQMGGAVYLLAAAGVALVLIHRRGLGITTLMLSAASLLAPAYHIYKHEPISLDKHIAYGLFFAAPMVGYFLAWLSGAVPRRSTDARRSYWLAGLAVVIALFTLGLRQSHALYSNWADTTDLSYALHTQLRNDTGRILAEDIEVARYDAKDVTQEWQWNSFYYPYYVDPAGHHLFGNQALIEALHNRYYSLVELSFNYFPAEGYWFAQQMAQTRNYDLIAVARLQNSYGRGHFFLWRAALEPGRGNFTSVAQVTTKTWFKCTARICQP